MGDWLGWWLGRMAQLSEEIVSYLVRYLLCQVIGLLHLLRYEMLRCWLGLLLRSTAQTEDTRRNSRAFKWRRQSPVIAELLPATSESAVTPSGRCRGGQNALSKDFTSSEISDAPTALCISHSLVHQHRTQEGCGQGNWEGPASSLLRHFSVPSSKR